MSGNVKGRLRLLERATTAAVKTRSDTLDAAVDSLPPRLAAALASAVAADLTGGEVTGDVASLADVAWERITARLDGR